MLLGFGLNVAILYLGPLAAGPHQDQSSNHRSPHLYSAVESHSLISSFPFCTAQPVIWDSDSDGITPKSKGMDRNENKICHSIRSVYPLGSGSDLEGSIGTHLLTLFLVFSFQTTFKARKRLFHATDVSKRWNIDLVCI